MKKTMTGGAVLMALTVSLGVTELAAQQVRGPGARGPAVAMDRGMRGGAPAVERILRMQDRLELSDDQVTRLDALRGERVQRRMAEATELAEVRSRLAAGTLQRAEVRERMQELREARRARGEQDRAEVESILNEEQRATLQQLQSQRLAFEAGRRSAMRDQARGMRGARDRPTRDRRPRGPGR